MRYRIIIGTGDVELPAGADQETFLVDFDPETARDHVEDEGMAG